VVAEAVVVAAVVGVTTVLVATPPARTTYGPATTLTAPLAAGRAEIRIEPTRAGVQTVVVRTLDADGDAVAAAGVTATLGSAAVSGIAVPLQQGTDGAWRGAAVVPIPGTWRLSLTVRLPEGTFVTAADYRTW
jgi:copper transport protein